MPTINQLILIEINLVMEILFPFISRWEEVNCGQKNTARSGIFLLI